MYDCLSEKDCRDEQGQNERKGLSLIHIYNEEEDIDDTIALKTQIKKLYDAINKKLGAREKKVLQMRYGLGDNEPITQREIAKMLSLIHIYSKRGVSICCIVQNAEHR